MIIQAPAATSARRWLHRLLVGLVVGPAIWAGHAAERWLEPAVGSAGATVACILVTAMVLVALVPIALWIERRTRRDRA